MLDDMRMHDAALAQTSVVAVRRPSRGANGPQGGAGLAGRRRRVPAVTGGVNAIAALLLLLLMPLGLPHRSSTGGCRYDHRAAVAGSAVAVNDDGPDVSIAASADHERIALGDPHDHPGSDLPLDGAASSACGPAALAERPAPMSVTPPQSALPDWRALSPLTRATPPPAPPPRLS